MSSFDTMVGAALVLIMTQNAVILVMLLSLLKHGPLPPTAHDGSL